MPFGVLRRFPVPTVSLYTIISTSLLLLSALYAHNTLERIKAELSLPSAANTSSLSLSDNVIDETLETVTTSTPDKISGKINLTDHHKSELRDDDSSVEERDLTLSQLLRHMAIKDDQLDSSINSDRKSAAVKDAMEEKDDLDETKIDEVKLNKTELARSILNEERSHLNGMLVLMVNEQLCLLTLANAVYCQLTLISQFIRMIVFGKLRTIERQHMKEKFWNFVFYKFIFIFGVMNVQSVNEMLAWVSWFALIVLLHLHTKLSKDRFEYLSFSPNTPMKYHYKVCALLVAIVAACACMGAFACLSTFGAFFQAMGAVTEMEHDRQAAFFLLTECFLVAVKASHVLLRYGIHLKDVQHDELWEQKATLVYHVDLVMELLHLTTKFVHHLHMLLSGNVWLSMASLVICMQLRHTFSEIQKRFLRHKNYRRVVANMEAQFPQATPEELAANEDQCAICWEQMESARKLPCSHLYHSACLRSWLEQDTTCPTCRKQLDIRNGRDDRERNAGGNNMMAPNRNDNQGAENDNMAEVNIGAAAGLAGEGGARAGGNVGGGDLWHFDGQRFASWLPSFYVQVMRPNVRRRRDARRTLLGQATRNSRMSQRVERMVQEVAEVFPQIPLAAIRTDLMMTDSVAATMENILDGRVASGIVVGGGADTPPELPPRHPRMLFNHFNNQRGGVENSDQPRNAAAADEDDGEALLRQRRPTNEAQHHHNHHHADEQDTDEEEEMDAREEDDPIGDDQPSTSSRSTLLQRQNDMIRSARLRYLSKYREQQQQYPLARYNTNPSGPQGTTGEGDRPHDDEGGNLSDESLG